MITSDDLLPTQFLQLLSSVFGTSMQLKNTINNYTDSNSNTIFSAIIDSKQNALTFGLNNFGQIGDGTNGQYTNRSTPTQIQGGHEDVIAVSCGGYHTAILKSDGTVYTFGAGTYGQLGNGYYVGISSYTDSNTPVLLVDINGDRVKDIIAVSCGENHTIILKSNGTVYTFGYNSNGQLGDGTTTNKNTLTQIQGHEDIIAVSCGGRHTAILKSDGTVYTFGRNDYGQLGLGNTTQKTTPTQIQGHEDVIAVSCGAWHTAILKSDGTVYTFGRNDYGQLGDGTTTNKTTPTQIQNHSDVIAVSCGGYHTAILKSDGTVYTFGNNAYGQLGLGNTTQKTTPTKIDDVNATDIIAVSCGGYHTAIIQLDGTIYTFGRNFFYQLGDGTFTTTDKNIPTQIQSHSDIIEVSCGDYHTAIIQGTIVDNKITIKRNIDTLNINLNSTENTVTGEGFTSITNFNHFMSTKIILTQETSNEHYNNSSLFDSDELGISDFTILEGTGADFPHNAAIPIGTIGTYQIINKFIECLSSIKRKVLDRYEIFQEKLQENKINKVYTFGKNDGQLGFTHFDNISIPEEVVNDNIGTIINDVIDVSCGETNTVILKSDGKVFVSGPLSAVGPFTQIQGHDDIIAISSGSGHAEY